MKIRIIGDVHGKYGEYLSITDGAEYSVQVGDMGFTYDHMKELNPLNHSFIGGNHDNYDIIGDVSHCHGNFGMRHKGDGARGPVLEYFIARGAYSVDKEYRTEGRSWWRNEEMNHDEANRCLNKYHRLRPDIVVSHDCPMSMTPFFLTNDYKLIPSFTGKLLEEMFQIHQPKMWFFGHHHNSKVVEAKGTKFTCLNELEYIDYEC
jgi:predicted phosphodiesterase